jgi:hypothetical protein
MKKKKGHPGQITIPDSTRASDASIEQVVVLVDSRIVDNAVGSEIGKERAKKRKSRAREALRLPDHPSSIRPL